MQSTAALALAALAAVACDRPDSTAGSGTSTAAPQLAQPPAATPGQAGMARPVITASGATLAAGKKPLWVELDLACYVAAITMDGQARPLDPNEKVRPGLSAALSAAGFDFENDLMTVGMTECGSGLCLYLGMALKDEAQMRALVTGVLGSPPEVVDPKHFVIRFQGPAGERAVHLRFLPIDWQGLALPEEPRARRLRRASHLLFVFADAASAPVPDPLALLAEPLAAQKRVGEIEALATDRRGRCAIGELPAMPGIRPGFD